MCNVGVRSPHEYGDYFAWGETKPKKSYSIDTYVWYNENQKYTKYNCDSKQGVVDSLTVLEPQDL